MSGASPRPWGVLLIGVFFALSTCIVLSVGLALLLPGSALEALWTLYAARRTELMPYREWLGPAFVALAVVMLLASIGTFRCREWGRWLAIAIFTANGVGDLTQVFMGKPLEGAVGVSVAGGIIFYLTRPSVRAAFAPSSAAGR